MNTNRIMVIDDELALSELIAEILQDTFPDLEVVTLGCAQDAIAWLTPEASETVQCVICDYNMPNGTGAKVFQHLRNRAKPMPFCLLSGGFLQDYRDLDGFDQQSKFHRFLEKPLHEQCLLEVVNGFLKLA